MLHPNLKTFLVLACALLAGAPTAFAASPARPNIIFILADDLGYGDVSCYGQKKFQTPNIDRLAAEGLRFTDFYAGCTVCAPSRSSLMTGQHTGHAVIRGNAEVMPEGQAPLPAQAVTLAEVMGGAGYVSGGFGKWGLGFVDTEGDPIKQGFTRFFGYNCQRMAHRAYAPYLWDGDVQVFLAGNDMHQASTYAPDVIHAAALDFIRQNRARPFFLYFPTTIPHAELLPPNDETFARFKGKFPENPYPGEVPDKWPGKANYGDGAVPMGYAAQPAPHAAFAAMVTRLDRYVGDILRLLDELGLADNTLVCFASDNGPHQEGGADPEFFDSNGPFRGIKRDLSEGGIRVPFIARWPGKIAAGRTSDLPAAFWDLMPTFAELAGAPAPKTTDGLSFVPTLLGRGEQRRHEYLYWEFNAANPGQAVRAGEWKAIRTFAKSGVPERFELYKVTADPGETHNLAFDEPLMAERMLRYMAEAHRYNAQFPLPPER